MSVPPVYEPQRRTAEPREAYERVLACTRCGEAVAVFDACMGARSAAEHEWVDPAGFVCAGCLGVRTPFHARLDDEDLAVMREDRDA